MKTFRLVWSFACAALMVTAPAAAQDPHDDEEKREIVIEVDEAGRLVIDGEPAGEEGRVVVRIAPDVEIEGPDGHFRLRGPDGRRIEQFMGRFHPEAFKWDGEKFARGFMTDFEPPRIPPIPDVRPMLDGFLAEWEDGIEHRFEEHQEVAELEREARQLADKVRRSEGAERADLELELRQTLEEIFEKKMEIRRERVERLEKRLEEQRSDLDERSDRREDMIERRMEHLLGDSDALEW